MAPLAVHSDTPGFSSNASAATGSDIYSYTGSGDLTFPSSSPAYGGAGKKSSQVNLCASSCGTTVVFSQDFVNHWPGDWQKCFGEGATTPEIGVPLFAGILRPDKKNPDDVRAQFWFQGKGTDGVKEVTYQLAATAVTSDTFPPAPGESATIAWASGVMLTEGKGKGSKGRNEGAACTGDATLDTWITLEGVS